MDTRPLLDYCPKCKRMTPHYEKEDDIFDFACQCSECGMIWEYSEPPVHEDDND
jgi:hypothetical protein